MTNFKVLKNRYNVTLDIEVYENCDQSDTQWAEWAVEMGRGVTRYTKISDNEFGYIYYYNNYVITDWLIENGIDVNNISDEDAELMKMKFPKMVRTSYEVGAFYCPNIPLI